VVTDDPWTEAYREAQERKLGYVGTDLLLLALARTTAVVGEVLSELGATPEAVSAAIDGLGLEPANDIDEARKEHPTDTPRTARARGRAEGVAVATGVPESSAHLLLALAYDRDGVHSAVLRRMGIDRGAIVTALADRGINVPPNAPAPDPEPHTLQLVLPAEQADVVIRALSEATVADQARFFDAHGAARWGFNFMPERPGFKFIAATRTFDLREFASEVLRAAGYPEPPEDAWQAFPLTERS
jgi:ATP-dependent Clp protease ATP-binding subunit ClpA